MAQAPAGRGWRAKARLPSTPARIVAEARPGPARAPATGASPGSVARRRRSIARGDPCRRAPLLRFTARRGRRATDRARRPRAAAGQPSARRRHRVERRAEPTGRGRPHARGGGSNVTSLAVQPTRTCSLRSPIAIHERWFRTHPAALLAQAREPLRVGDHPRASDDVPEGDRTYRRSVSDVRNDSWVRGVRTGHMGDVRTAPGPRAWAAARAAHRWCYHHGTCRRERPTWSWDRCWWRCWR